MKILRCIIYAALCGFLSGLLINCFLPIASITVALGYHGGHTWYLIICVAAALIALTAIVWIIILNYKAIADEQKIRLILFVEIAVYIAALFPSWILWEYLLHLII